MSFRKKMFLAAAVCFLGFTVFSYQVQKGKYTQIDFDTTVRIQDMVVKSGKLRMIESVDTGAELMVFLVSPEMSVLFLFLLTGIAFFSKKRGKFGWRAFMIPLLFGLLIFSELFGKSVVHHPAPPFFMVRNPVTLFPKYYVNEQFSYPSGHAARAVYLTVVAFFLFSRSSFAIRPLTKKQTRIIVFALGVSMVLGVFLGKIYLGHHWLSDIVGGGLVGVGFGFLAMCFLLNSKPLRR